VYFSLLQPQVWVVGSVPGSGSRVVSSNLHTLLQLGREVYKLLLGCLAFFFSTQDDKPTQSIVGEDTENSRSDCTSLLCSVASLYLSIFSRDFISCPAPVLFTGEGPLHPSSAPTCEEYKLSHPSSAVTTSSA